MSTLLAFTPHPDDESYSIAATLAAAGRCGWDCLVLCASDGERGKRHDGGRPGIEALRDSRRAELVASCALLGARAPTFLALPDGGVADGPALRRVVDATIRESAPDLLLTLGPDGAYGHPDHLALHGAVAAVWESLPDPPVLLFSSFRRGLFAPQWHRCRGMLGNPPHPPVSSLGDEEPHYELRARGLAGLKWAAIRAHRTQLPGGDPERLFPAGIVRGLISVERFRDARRRVGPEAERWFRAFQAVADAPSGG